MKKIGIWQTGVVGVTLGGLMTGVSFAQSAIDCSTVADDKARLKCYDDQARQKQQAAMPAAPAASASAAPATPAPAAKSSAPARAVAPATSASTSTPTHSASASARAPANQAASVTSDFGSETVRRKRGPEDPNDPKQAGQIVARVTDVTTKAHGEYRITLEGGQVWEETLNADSAPPKLGETVTVKRGMFGSYFLTHKQGPALRVQRVE